MKKCPYCDNELDLLDNDMYYCGCCGDVVAHYDDDLEDYEEEYDNE